MASNQKQFPQKISSPFEFVFIVPKDGFYAVFVSARCQSGKQSGNRSGEDLRVEIDNHKFREIPAADKPQYQDIPVAWNGSQLNGLKKTVIFIMGFPEGEHTINFIPDKGATIEAGPLIEPINSTSDIWFNLQEQAEDGDRRPWYAIALIDLPLKKLSAEVTAGWRFGDSDDVKLIVDGAIKENIFSVLHRNWLWSGSFLKKLFGQERQEKNFDENLGKGSHYIEFWADRTPTLHKIIFNLGEIKYNRTPAVDYPRWTGDFNDDSEQMILARAMWGEARSLSLEGRVGIAWSIRNRLGTIGKEGLRDNYHKVILEPDQYSAFWEVPGKDGNPQVLKDPLGTAKNAAEREKWAETYQIAGEVMTGSGTDPVHGANHYYSKVTPDYKPPYWATPGTFVIRIDNTYFHKL